MLFDVNTDPTSLHLPNIAENELKGFVRYIFASLFFEYKRKHPSNQEKKFLFIFKSSFFFSRKLNFRILDFHISWRHQIPKHETRNTFY